MKITQARLKEIVKEEIAEARLPDTMKAGYGDPQDDERPDAMGPRVPHEFQITGMWEKDLGIFIRHIDEYLKDFNKYGRDNPQYDRRMEEPLHMVRNLLKSRQDDLGKDLPVRRYGQDEPIDPTKHVEAPTEMEQKQMRDVFHLVSDAFSQMIMAGKPVPRGKVGEKYPLVDYIQLKKDIRSAMPHGGREYWSAPGGVPQRGGGYKYSSTGGLSSTGKPGVGADKPIYREDLQKIIDEEIEAVLNGSPE